MQTAVTGDDVVITGEVVNLSPKPMDVGSLAGAVLDNAGTVLAANSTQTYTRYLYPANDPQGRDRGPFIVKLFGPIENLTQWKVYARPVENSSTPSVKMDLQLTGSYFDQYGTYHVLGTLTNNGSSQISPSILGSLHNQDQTILDTASLNVPFYLNAGESTPFDINTFQVVGSLPADNASSAKKILAPDLYWTFTTSHETVALDQDTLHVKQDNSSWQASGTVTNRSDQKLSSINALIQCLDANNQPVVVNYTSIYPASDAEYIAPSITSDFKFDLYPPVDTTELNNCQTTFQGIKAE